MTVRNHRLTRPPRGYQISSSPRGSPCRNRPMFRDVWWPFSRLNVEGYSRLMGADEIGTLKSLTEQRAILDATIARNRRRIANTAGDGVLAEFVSAVDAVQCAVEAQASLAAANAGIPPEKRINFRIG